MCHPRVVRLLPLLAVAVACRGREARRPGDTMPLGASASVAAAGSPGAWTPELGDVLLVPSVTENAAVVLFPEAPASHPIPSATVTLISASGDTTVVRVAAIVSDSVECGDAPLVSFGTANLPAWSIGLATRSARILKTDSIGTLASADSSRMAAELARLASTLPMRPDSRFTGLPFSVLGARRFQADDRQVVVAQVVRRLSQEAAPLEERTLIIGERPASARPNDRYTLTYSRRSEGSEEAAEHFDVLAAIRGGQSTMLWLAREQPTGTTYELLEKANGGWRVRWMRSC